MPAKQQRCAKLGCTTMFTIIRYWQKYCSPRCRFEAWKLRQEKKELNNEANHERGYSSNY